MPGITALVGRDLRGAETIFWSARTLTLIQPGERQARCAGRQPTTSLDCQRAVRRATRKYVRCGRECVRRCPALGRLRDTGMPFISVLLNPTTGGVAASYALLGDVNLAEPQALIGFAGPRVIEQTIRQKLPEGFQRSEFLLEHGMIDLIAERKAMRATIARVIGLLAG